ncbi:hypothetical protein M427DRAFT_59813 [Gonapodya prolifera JEL478]|uniref:RING-type domain-containing protein n=1 Tax=Gonapodya prolifera (strain JEL478) TaxID=1344416 RepID=A0A139A5S1_GONPJ|nr:hypothetical protein M427DRAFT_59813 [Gonapodya prolifera JEL478]|eukprot:KXS12127.1 hypothetical protein M427DRAFT_59813 [Gonapodya prolifera JEL478]
MDSSDVGEPPSDRPASGSPTVTTNFTPIPRPPTPIVPTQGQNSASRTNTNPLNPTVETDGPRDNPSLDVGPGVWTWLSWRVWSTTHLIANAVTFSLGLASLLHDIRVPLPSDSSSPSSPDSFTSSDATTSWCDRRLANYVMAQCALRALQIGICASMVVVIPHRMRRYTWRVYRRVLTTSALWTLSTIILLAQIIMVPVGFGVVRFSDPSCYDPSNPATAISTTTTILLIFECAAFVFLGLPTFVLPCVYVLSDLPRYLGTTALEFSQIPTQTVPPHPTSSSSTTSVPEDDVCAVCLEQTPPGTRVKVLRCGHKFHEGCIWGWLEARRICPYCREPIDAAPRVAAPASV